MICHPINSLKRTAKALENWAFWASFQGSKFGIGFGESILFTCYEVGAPSPFYRFITRLKKGFFRPQVTHVFFAIFWGLICLIPTKGSMNQLKVFHDSCHVVVAGLRSLWPIWMPRPCAKPVGSWFSLQDQHVQRMNHTSQRVFKAVVSRVYMDPMDIKPGWWFHILNVHPYLGKWSSLTNTVHGRKSCTSWGW